MFLFDILVFLLVLSVLVAVHEFGHFIAAKACNIYVDQFSIGMPPRIAGFKWGETDYCIGALPIGGYVKMAGQEDAPLTEEERERTYGEVPSERWFNNKPVWQRAIVLVAGPAMNIVLAVLIYMLLAAWGSEVPEFELNARIGNVEEGSPAATAPLYLEVPGQPIEQYTGEPADTGWKTGDEIISLNGKPVENIARLAMMAILGGDSDVRTVVIERTGDDGRPVRFVSPVTPEYLDEDEEYPRFGVGPFESARVVELVEEMPAQRAGLQSDDVITHINGERIDRGGLIERIAATPAGEQLALTVERGDEILDITLVPERVGRMQDIHFGTATRDADEAEAMPVVVAITSELQGQLGLKPGDEVRSINGQPATVARLKEVEQASAGQAVTLDIHRPGKLFGLRRPAQDLKLEVPVQEVAWVGVSLGPKMVFHRVPTSEILSEALYRSKEAITLTLGTIKALALQNVSPKDIGGPLMIFDVTTKAAEAGIAWLLKITAFISVNLAIFNLLPLPVLDGGQLVINGLEAIRRKPLSMAFQERFQQVGLVLIIALMLFVTWNDIGRMLAD